MFHYMSQYGLPDESCLSYTATDHRLYNQSVESCPYGARCRNCMPKNGTDTCWAVKTPILVSFFLSLSLLQRPGSS